MSIPQITVPKYATELPISKIKLEFRPFLVKEEKIFLIAMETGNPTDLYLALKQVIEACTFNKCDIDKLALGDIEFLFVKIRNKSMGEGLDLTVTCTSCEKKFETQVNMENIKVTKATLEPDIKLDDDTWVTMGYPLLKDSYATEPTSSKIDEYELMAKCIKKIIYKNEVYDSFTKEEAYSFLENLMGEQLNKIRLFMNDEPKVYLDSECKCPLCGNQNKIKIESLENFFV